MSEALESVQEAGEHVSEDAVCIALSLFTGEGGVYRMYRPWLADGYVYASNRASIVRVPARQAPWVGHEPNRTVPPAGDLPWSRDLYQDKAVRWPRLPPAIAEACRFCGMGYGGMEETGAHEVAYETNPMPCPSCGWVRTEETPATVQIGYTEFRASLLRRVRSLGADLYAPLRHGEGARSAWMFEVRDLRMVGLVLPLKPIVQEAVIGDE